MARKIIEPVQRAGCQVLVIAGVLDAVSWVPMPVLAAQIVSIVAFIPIACAFRLFWLARHLGRGR